MQPANSTLVQFLESGSFFFVMAGHSRSKNGVASLAYVPAIHVFLAETL